MLSRNDVQLKLLRKFNELCNKAQVKYVLHGQVAFLAYRNDEFRDVESLDVIMCQGDAEKIADLLDDDAFYFEDFRSNPKFDEHYMIFGYNDSIDLKIRDLNFLRKRHIENNCIRINIHFVERIIPEGSIKTVQIKRKLWQLKNTNVSKKIPKLYYYNKFINQYYKVKGKKRSINSRYQFKKKQFSISTWDEIKNYPKVKSNGTKGVKSFLFDEIIEKDIEGIPVYIFKDFELYATSYYGKKWEEKEWMPSNAFKSSIVSWKDFSSEDEVQKCFEEIQKCDEIIYLGTAESLKYRRVITKMRQNVIQSGKIIHTREEFIAKKEKLFELYEKGDLNQLTKEFDPLIQAMQDGIRIGYTYSVDEDIDKLLDSYLKDMGKGELAKKIQDLREDV